MEKQTKELVIEFLVKQGFKYNEAPFIPGYYLCLDGKIIYHVDVDNLEIHLKEADGTWIDSDYLTSIEDLWLVLQENATGRGYKKVTYQLTDWVVDVVVDAETDSMALKVIDQFKFPMVDIL